jgi:6-phosphogluconolactonase
MSVYTRITPEAFADVVSRKLTDLLAHKPQVNLALPGGSTPKRFLESLSKADLEWNRINVFLTDERWVDISSEQSNEKLIREHLLQGKARHAIFYGIYQQGLTIEQSVQAINQKFGDTGPAFDIIILGMGDDTHIASIFPGNREIYTIDGIYAAASELHSSGLPRVSLTPGTITRAELVILAISGENKEAALTLAWGSGVSIINPVLLLKERPIDELLIYSIYNNN